MTTPKRILVIRTGGVGDFILSLPLMRALAATWPDAELEILGRPAIAALARPHVTLVTSIDDRRFARLFSGGSLDASDPARAYLSSFDLVVSFLGIPKSDFGRNLRAVVPRTLFIPPPTPGAKHAAIHFLESLGPPIVAGLGARRLPDSLEREPGHNVPRIDISAEDQEGGKLLLQRLLGQDDGAIIVHPGSGGRDKNWPPQLFAQTVRLWSESGHSTILLQGEADGEAVRQVLDDLGQDAVPVLKDASLVQVAGAIACSRLVVGNDSGISHLAAAVGTPLICLFGPTDPTVWRPLGAAVRVLTFAEATPERVCEEGIRLTTTE